ISQPPSVGGERRISRLAKRKRSVRVRCIAKINLRRMSLRNSRKCVLAFGKKRRSVDIQRRWRQSRLAGRFGLKVTPHRQTAPALVVAHKGDALAVGGEHRLTRIINENARRCPCIDNRRTWT